MEHSWHASGRPGGHFCARCGVETLDGEPQPPGPCTPPPLAMCKHARELEAQKQQPFGVIIVAALPGQGFEGARFEMNCCRRCWLAIVNLAGDLELKP